MVTEQHIMNSDMKQSPNRAHHICARTNCKTKNLSQLRSALIEAVTPEDVTAIARKMIEMATAGDIQAIREVLLRVLGRPQEADLIERLEKIEETVEAGQ